MAKKLTDLEMRLKERFRQVCDQAKKVGVLSNDFLRMIEDRGPVETAKSLLATGARVQKGFTDLALLEKLEFTMEQVVLEPEFKRLFSDEERKEARRRLGKLDRKF